MGEVISFRPPAGADPDRAAQTAVAERTLRTALLAAQGADMALGPLHGIGRLSCAALLLLRRRRARMPAAPH